MDERSGGGGGGRSFRLKKVGSRMWNRQMCDRLNHFGGPDGMDAGGAGQHGRFGAPGTPDVGIGSSEERDNRQSEGGRHVRRSAVVANEERCAGQQRFNFFERGARKTAVLGECIEALSGTANENRLKREARS